MYGVSIPTPVKDWLGLSNYDAAFHEGGIDHAQNLVDMSDNEVTFPELAAIIRQEPPGLFD